MSTLLKFFFFSFQAKPRNCKKFLDVTCESWVLLYGKHSTTEDMPTMETVQTKNYSLAKFSKPFKLSKYDFFFLCLVAFLKKIFFTSARFLRDIIIR